MPHINIKNAAARVTSLRVFQSGSVIIVSRWPVEMSRVYNTFLSNMDRFKEDVLDQSCVRRQGTRMRSPVRKTANHRELLASLNSVFFLLFNLQAW